MTNTGKVRVNTAMKVPTMSASLGGGWSEALADGLPDSMSECILQLSYVNSK